MAKYNDSICITFNDNDGSIGWSYNPSSAKDIHRYQHIFGKIRTRWILIKQFYIALKRLEEYVEEFEQKEKPKLWIFRSEIPE